MISHLIWSHESGTQSREDSKLQAPKEPQHREEMQSDGCKFSVEGPSSLKCFLLAQVALSKEFSGTWCSYAAFNSGPTLLEYCDIFGRTLPQSSDFGSDVCELLGTSKMREQWKPFFKKNSRHMAMGEVAVGGWAWWRYIAIVTITNPLRNPEQIQAYGLSSNPCQYAGLFKQNHAGTDNTGI